MKHRRQEDHLISQHRALARQLARRFSPGPMVDEDLLSVATTALVAAARRFETDRNIPFHSFAAPTIVGEIKRFLRDQTWAVHVPRRLKELAVRMEGVQRSGQQELGRSLTVDELAERLDVEPDTILEGMEAAGSRRSGPLTTIDRAAPQQDWDEVATFVSIEQAMEQLSEDERGALLLRYSEDLTQAEIGARLGFSQPHVHRLINRGLDNLRSHFELADR
jgi:RNA polymerase sigma-B factor